MVIGLAETGVAVARVLRAEGADVVVVEDSPSSGARYAGRVGEVRRIGVDLVEAPTAAQVRELVDGVDLVVPSPLVTPGHVAVVEAQARGIPVRSEIDVAAERASVPFVAVTGTNGKTTVTTMIADMLGASGVPAIAAGNLGRPLVEAVGDESLAGTAGVIVAEVSSFQLAFAHESFRPRVAVLLAVTPDHLDWHRTFDDYLAAKARITAHQTGDDLLVYDADDDVRALRSQNIRLPGGSGCPGGLMPTVAFGWSGTDSCSRTVTCSRRSRRWRDRLPTTGRTRFRRRPRPWR